MRAWWRWAGRSVQLGSGVCTAWLDGVVGCTVRRTGHRARRAWCVETGEEGGTVWVDCTGVEGGPGAARAGDDDHLRARTRGRRHDRDTESTGERHSLRPRP